MRLFIKKSLFFILPVFILLIPPLFVLWITGENLREIKPVIVSDKDYLIGYAYNENNYKYLKWLNLNNSPRHKIIALGSSRVLQFRHQMFDSSFYNAGFTITGIKDFKGFLQSIPDTKHPDYLIVNLDQWMFNKNYDNLEASVSDEKWSDSFSKYPSVQIMLKIYSDLFTGKYSFGMLKNKNDTITIGLNAVINKKGFRNDGSYYYGNQITKLLNNDPLVEDYQYHETLKNIDNGDICFKFGNHINQGAIQELEDFLIYCQKHNIQLIAILPPFADKVYNHLKTSGNFQYMEEIYHNLKPFFDKYNFELYDYSSVKYCNSNDDETLDGFHGSEMTYIKLLMDILSQNSSLNKVSDITKLQNDKENKINRYVIYNN